LGSDVPAERPVVSDVEQGGSAGTAEWSLEDERLAKRPVASIAVAPRLTPGAAIGSDDSNVFAPKQFWEGTVDSVSQGEFVAVVRDKTNPSNPDEEVVISLDEVMPSERPLVAPGATFYWFIGPEYTPSGRIKNVSLLEFQRLPRWSRSAVDRARNRARRLRASFPPRQRAE
jgi:hypothetical protein